VKLECAQCHDHPFASWKREQFWNFAAFFSGVKRQAPGEFVVPGREEISKREIAIPNTDRVAKARFLDGKDPAWRDGVGTREILADWITRSDNSVLRAGDGQPDVVVLLRGRIDRSGR